MDFRTLAKASRLLPAISFLIGAVLLPLFPIFGLAALILAALLVVARYDNDAGTYLPLAVLLVIVLLVMALLLASLAYIHALMSGAR